WAILSFSLAIFLKYHAILLLPLVMLEWLSRRNQTLTHNLGKIALFMVMVLVIPAIYLISVKETFGFWLSPPAFQNVHALEFDPSIAITHLINYGGYLVILLAPFSIFAVRNRLRTPRAAVTACATGVTLFAIGFFFIGQAGEMDFGPLDAYLNTGVVC